MKAGKDNTDVKTLPSNASQTLCLNYSTSMCYSSSLFMLYFFNSVLGTVENGKTPLQP